MDTDNPAFPFTPLHGAHIGALPPHDPLKSAHRQIDSEITTLQTVLRLYAHVCELQQRCTRLESRVQQLEHDKEMESMLGGAEAFSQ